MDIYPQYLSDRLREREEEFEKLNENFREVRNKLTQLEYAFQINFQAQQEREDELSLLKLESQNYRKLNEESVQTKAELATRLMKAISESDHWKKAFLQQKRTNFLFDIAVNLEVELQRKKRRQGIEIGSKFEHENFVASVKRECEDILEVTRNTAEKYFRELVQLYETARGKSELLQKQVIILQQKYKNKQERTLELANLLETLAQFNVNVESVCQNAAEVLRNFEEHDFVHVEKMRKLRQLTWEAKQSEFQDEEQLRIQNSVLREIVKSLKKKIANSYSESKEQIPERDESPKCINHSNTNEYSKPVNFPYEVEKNIKNDMNPERNQISKCFDKPEKLNLPLGYQSPKNPVNQNEKFSGINKLTFGPQIKKGSQLSKDLRGKENNVTVPYIERLGSHLNGVPYEEYVIKFSRNHEMKLKHSPAQASGEFPLKIQFVDDEEEYQDASLDKISIFLKNIERVVRLKQNGMNCGVQTKRIRVSNSYAQTMLTNSSSSFSRLNVGVTMLNSEKRAIERCLSKLERTVADLKFNAAHQARPMMEKDSKYAKNGDYLGYDRLLER